MRIIRHAWILVPLIPGSLPAADIDLSLRAAVERAQAEAPRLRQLAALQEAAHAAARMAQGNRWPAINATAGYTRLSEVPELTTNFGSGAVTIFPNLPDAYRTRIEASLPLFTGWRISAIEEAAKAREAAARGDHRTSTSDLILETTVAYWTWVTTAETETVLSAALASYQAHLRDAENREKGGMAARNDVLAVEVERRQAELSLLEAKSGTGISHANLLRLLDFPPDTRLRPTESLDVTTTASPPLETLIDKALASRAERVTLFARLEEARHSVRAARSGYFPQISALGGYDYARPNRRILPTRDDFEGTWDVGVALSMNLFEGGSTRAAVDRAKAEAEGVRQQLLDLDRRIRFEVTARALDLASSQAAVPVAAASVDSAAENRKVSQDRYRAGVIPSSELLDAETALLRAGLKKVDVLARLRMAQARLARATGE